MKKTLTSYGIALAFAVVSTLILSAVLTSLQMKNGTQNDLYDKLLYIISGIVFLLAGLFIGLKVKSRGILHGIGFTLFYAFILFIFFTFGHKIDFLNSGIKSILVILGCIIGVNMRKS